MNGRCGREGKLRREGVEGGCGRLCGLRVGGERRVRKDGRSRREDLLNRSLARLGEESGNDAPKNQPAAPCWPAQAASTQAAAAPLRDPSAGRAPGRPRSAADPPAQALKRSKGPPRSSTVPPQAARASTSRRARRIYRRSGQRKATPVPSRARCDCTNESHLERPSLASSDPLRRR